MQKLFFTGLALFGLFRVIAQGPDTTSPYKLKTIKIEEINLVSSLYHQEGNNSAVTGGIGTEKLTDVANSLDISRARSLFLSFIRQNRFECKFFSFLIRQSFLSFAKLYFGEQNKKTNYRRRLIFLNRI